MTLVEEIYTVTKSFPRAWHTLSAYQLPATSYRLS
jgi:hypothetical protein